MEDRHRKLNALIKHKKRATLDSESSNKDVIPPIDPDDQMTEEELELAVKALEDLR